MCRRSSCSSAYKYDGYRDEISDLNGIDVGGCDDKHHVVDKFDAASLVNDVACPIYEW
jgi:hypothetical protein